MNKLLTIGVLLLLNALVPSAAVAQNIEQLNFKKPVRFSGSLHLQLESYSANNLENRRKPFSWMISGSPTLTILDIPVPVSFLLSNFENRYYQPFNQYGISPKYKWITVHAGYRNVQFSPFTLAGYRMLGGGVELNPGKLRLGFMYGRLNKSTAIDSAQFANPLAYRPIPSYTRMAYAGKIGWGGDRNFFDISFLKGWDKEGSMKNEYRDSIAPAENIAIGFSWKRTLFKKLVWNADIGISHFSADKDAEKLKLDSSYPKMVRTLTGIFDTRISSGLLTAGQTSLSYQGKIAGLSLQYRRIDPEYESMGAYFFQSDIEQFNLAPSFRLLKGRLLVNGSAGYQRDNLYRQKLATSERLIGNMNVNYYHSPIMGFNFSYSNFGVTQNPLRTAPNDDIFKQVSQSFTLIPYFNLSDGRTAKNIQVIASYQSLNSPVKTINTAPDQHTLFGSAVYSHTWLSQQVSLNASLNYNNTRLPAGGIGSYGAGAGASVPLLKRKLLFNGNAHYNSNSFNGSSNGYTINGNAAVSTRFWKRNSIQLAFIYLKNESKDQSAIQSFDEKTFRVGYGLTF